MEKEQYRIGYARVSKSDDRQDNSLKEQIKLLEENNCVEVFFEKQSGGNDVRQKFNSAIKRAKRLSKKYNVSIVCYRLDRLARSPRLILNTLADLDELGINIISISENLDSSTEIGKMMIQMLSVVSSWELNSIRARVKVGVANARARGVKLGRPKKLTKSTTNKVIRLYQLNTLSVKDIAKRCSISESSCYSILKDSNITRRR